MPSLTVLEPNYGGIVVNWTDESSDPQVIGYRLYYDQGGPSQLLAELLSPATTLYEDSNLPGGTPNCYKVASLYAGCESALSASDCATPYIPGDLNRDMAIGLDDVVASLLILSGKTPPETVYLEADVNEDHKLGLQEAIMLLQKVAGLR